MQTGILLSNLGTPDAPTTPALRRYLKEFLSDRRVIDLPRWKWYPILHGIVLRTRPRKSAALYRKVWTDQGSPLLAISRKQQAGLEQRLGMPVALGMRYGNPSIGNALDELKRKGCGRILVMPLYPQCSRATTESTYDVLPDGLLRTGSYHDDVGYIGALAGSVREAWTTGEAGEPERLLMSFHGIPQRYHEAGDIYPDECCRTAELLATELGLSKDRWFCSFQSRFGKEEWIKPYTDETLKAWGSEGLGRVDVICPGFSADCLETLDEVARENRAYFERSGGGRFKYIPALNERGDHLDALAAIARRALA